LCNRDYPTVSLTAERRLKLLQLAKEYQFAIIEDDYDYDFQFEGLAMLPMASSDANGMVIYLGKLGQSLFPSFQTGFVVARKFNFRSQLFANAGPPRRFNKNKCYLN
jgi:GntR family transcriptional regulator/MocR family aminotransferase